MKWFLHCTIVNLTWFLRKKGIKPILSQFWYKDRWKIAIHVFNIQKILNLRIGAIQMNFKFWILHKVNVKHLRSVQMMLLSAVERLENQIEIFVSIYICVIDSYEYHVITELFMIQQRCSIFHSFHIIRNPKWFIFKKSPLKIAICFENKWLATSLWIFH